MTATQTNLLIAGGVVVAIVVVIYSVKKASLKNLPAGVNPLIATTPVIPSNPNGEGGGNPNVGNASPKGGGHNTNPIYCSAMGLCGGVMVNGGGCHKCEGFWDTLTSWVSFS